MSTTYTIASHTPAFGTRVGGYPDADGNLYTVPTAVYGEYEGGLYDTEAIVAWVKGQADQFFGAGTWVVDGVDIKDSDDDEVDRLRIFAPGSDTPLDLRPYESYLDTEEDEDDPDFTLIEDDDSTTGRRLDVLTPIQQIINAAAQGLFDNIVADVPQDEADLRQRFEAFGLLT